MTQPRASTAKIEQPDGRPPTAVRPTRVRRAVRAPDRPRWVWGSDGLVAAVIGVFGLAFWVPAAVHADFMLDDWAELEHFELSHVAFSTFRPVDRLRWDIAYRLFGTHPTGYYVTLAVMMALIGMAFYTALRRLGLSAVPAAIAGIAIVAYPRADSIGAWWADPAAPALLLGLVSVVTGAIWVTRRGRALRWLLPTLALVALSVLCYEATAPMFLLALCLAPLSPNLRRTFVCGAASGLVALGSSLYAFTVDSAGHNAIGVRSYGSHAKTLLTGGWQALVLHGLSTPTAVGFGLAVVPLLAVAVVLGWRRAAVFFEPWRRLLVTVPLLVVAAVLSLIPFVPTGPYYEPTAPSTGNRVNSLAQVFVLVLIAVGIWLVCRLVGTLVGGRLALSVASVAAAVIAVIVMSGYAGYVKQDQNDYNAASAQRAGDIAEIHSLRPVVPRRDLVLLGDFASQIGPPGAQWFPTIEDLWDASEIVSLTAHRGNLAADPLFAGTQCLAGGVAVQIPTGSETVPYARVMVIDLGRHRVEGLADQAQCRADLPKLVVTV